MRCFSARWGRRALYSLLRTTPRCEPEQLPSSTSPDYGTPFYDIFKRYNNDFYKIDPMLFSPAEVWLTSASSGHTFHAGQPNIDVLRASLVGG